MGQVLAQAQPHTATGTFVNDLHSALNPTQVAGRTRIRSVGDIQRAVWLARSDGLAVCIAAGRHAMGALFESNRDARHLARRVDRYLREGRRLSEGAPPAF